LHYQHERRKRNGDSGLLPSRVFIIGICCSFLPRMGMEET
jgi:hypothetical protein